MTSEEEMRINVIVATHLMMGIERSISESVDGRAWAVGAKQAGSTWSKAEASISYRHLQHEKSLFDMTLFLLKRARQSLENAHDDTADSDRGLFIGGEVDWRFHLRLASQLITAAAVYFNLDILSIRLKAIDADHNVGIITNQAATVSRETLLFQYDLLQTIDSLLRVLVVFPRHLSPMYRETISSRCPSIPGKKSGKLSMRKKRRTHDRSSS